MKIKGFDKNLCCRGMQFEVGKDYDTGAKEEELALYSDTVFHYCDSLKQVHSFYNCKPDTENRFCEIHVLGKEITDGGKCGSNKITIVREIVGEELNLLRGTTNGNSGVFNNGSYNSGDWNNGNYNSGSCNNGNRNSGDWNSGDYNSGDYNSGDWNSGSCNNGSYNSGDRNSGDWNSGNRNSGDRNSGSYNSGDRNSGDWNSGDWNSGDGVAGYFCTKPQKVYLFNKLSNFTQDEFRKSVYYRALISVPFELTEWVRYSKEEMLKDKQKELTGGYLKTISYKDACKAWWDKMSLENKEIVKSIPGFDAKVFEEITGISVARNRK